MTKDYEQELYEQMCSNCIDAKICHDDCTYCGEFLEELERIEEELASKETEEAEAVEKAAPKFKYEFELSFFNLKTRSNFTQSMEIHCDSPLVTYNSETNERVFNFDCPYFKNLCDLLSKDIHFNFGKALVSSIKSRLRDTYKGIKVVFRDEDNLIWHCFVTIIDKLN